MVVYVSQFSSNNKNTKFLAGGTDLNLDKNYFDNPSYIHLCRIPELSKIELNANISIGVVNREDML